MRRGPLALGLFVAAVTAVAGSPSARAEDPTVTQCLSASEHGQLDRDEGRYLKAREALMTCSSGACPPVVQRDCLRWLGEIDATMPTLVFVVRNGSGNDLGEVVVRVDGQLLLSRLEGKPVAVDPGEHVFSFEAGGHRVQSRALVNVGERNRVLRISLDDGTTPRPADLPPPSGPPTPASSPVPVGSLVFGGIAALAVGSAAFLWLSASSDLRSLESDPCAARKTCAASDVQSVRTRMVVGDVLAGVGVAALGAAAVLWLTHDRSMAMTVSPGGGGLMGRGLLLRMEANF